MSVVLSHETAFRVYVKYRYLAQGMRCPLPEAQAFLLSDLSKLQNELGLCNEQTHLLATTHNQERTIPSNCPIHYCKVLGGLPAFIRLNNAYVACPELTFVQMAATLSFVDALLFGFYLCGDYRSAEQRFSSGELPLSTVERLEAFIGALPNINGVKTARKTLRYLANNSNSHQESRLAIMLLLPARMGGFGIETPHLNMPVPGTSRKGDLCWPEHKLILEYDSRLHHENEDRQTKDSVRFVQLGLEDYRVISVHPEQVQNLAHLNELGGLVSRLTGKRSRATSQKYLQTHYALWQQLFKKDSPKLQA